MCTSPITRCELDWCFLESINRFSNWAGFFFFPFLFFSFFLFFFWIQLFTLRKLQYVATHREGLSRNCVPPSKQCTCCEFSSEDHVVKLAVKKIYQFSLCDAGSGTKCHQSLGKLNVKAGTWNAVICPFPLLQVIEYLREKHGKDITRKDIMECFMVGDLCLKRGVHSRSQADLCVFQTCPYQVTTSLGVLVLTPIGSHVLCSLFIIFFLFPLKFLFLSLSLSLSLSENILPDFLSKKDCKRIWRFLQAAWDRPLPPHSGRW